MKPFDRRGLEFLWARFDSSTSCSFKIQIHLLIKELCYNIYIFLNTYNIYLSLFFSHHHQLIGLQVATFCPCESCSSSAGRCPRVPMTPDRARVPWPFQVGPGSGAEQEPLAARSLNRTAVDRRQ